MAGPDRWFSPESPLQTRFFFLAKRFVAGETIESALAVVAALNAGGILATLDFLGEDVTQPDEARRTLETYLTLLRAIRERRAAANVSVKLTALGLRLDENLAAENLAAIVAAARENPDPFVRIDMESSAVTDATLRVFERVFSADRNVGPALQAYLRRTPGDVERAIALGARVRLCKGAYREPREVAFRRMPTIRREYLRLAEMLLRDGNYPAFATHDMRIIDAIRAYARANGIGNERFEFQLLYGVHPELQRRLHDEGRNVRVYVPFGTHWARYFYRRITERKENALFVLRSLLRR
jgi:proline dehydrogenase